MHKNQNIRIMADSEPPEDDFEAIQRRYFKMSTPGQGSLFPSDITNILLVLLMIPGTFLMAFVALMVISLIITSR